MKQFVLDAFVKPFFAILFCVVFGGGFIFVGHQTVDVAGQRDVNGNVSMDFNRKHFWGLLEIKVHIENPTKATIETSSTGHGSRRRITSAVYVYSGEKRTSVFLGSSNVDRKVKEKVKEKLNTFINVQNMPSFSETFAVRNVFYWVGLPFFAIGLLGIIGWPQAIIACWKKRKQVS